MTHEEWETNVARRATSMAAHPTNTAQLRLERARDYARQVMRDHLTQDPTDLHIYALLDNVVALLDGTAIR